ncbi:hypothetical protein [Corticicoccus populi]|uniref:Uncharacterized protein n=1 Tax=Corticicoccus populi TaxID=1812821 RepID=A0ABW5WX61_9STAP
MTLKIKRRTRWYNVFYNIKIKLNGEKVSELEDHKEVEINMPEDNMELETDQFATLSNKISVSDGDHVLITSRRIMTFAHLLGLSILMIASSIFLYMTNYHRSYMLGQENFFIPYLILIPLILFTLIVGMKPNKVEVVSKSTYDSTK